MQIRFSKIIELLIIININAVFFLVPVFFGVFPKIYNAFELAKMSLFMILVFLLLFFTAIKIIFYSQKSARQLIIIIKKHKVVFTFLLFYFFTLLISTVFSIDPKLSVIGYYFRLEGLVSYIFYFLFFILLILNLDSREKIRSALLAAILGSAVICVYGLLQAFGADPILWSESTKIRISSTMGQPNHLGSYLLFIIPITLYFIFTGKSKVLKIIFIGLLLLQLFALFGTYSISSWLGLTAGLFIIGALALFSFSQEIKTNILNKYRVVSKNIFFNLYTHLSLIILIFLLVFLAFNFNFTTLKSKADNVFDFRAGSTAARVQFWSAALKAIKKRPFIGYGLDTQREILAKYYEPDWAVYSDVNVRPSRAHNIWLDTLLTQGIVGLLAYLALLYVFVRLIIRNIKHGKDIMLNYAILFGLFSYFVYLQFNYHNTSTQIFFWLFLAIIIILAARPDNSDNVAGLNKSQIIKKNNNNYFLKSLAAAIVFVIIAGGIKYSFLMYDNDHYFFEFRSSVVSNSFYAAIDLDRFMNKTGMYYKHYDEEMAVIYSDWIKKINRDSFVELGRERLKIILSRLEGHSSGQQYARARAYAALALSEPKYYSLAEDELNKLAWASPKLPKYHREMGRLYFDEEKYSEAIKQFRLALFSLPDLDNVYFNSKHLQAARREAAMSYEGLYRSYEQLKDVEQTEYYKNLFENTTKL